MMKGGSRSRPRWRWCQPTVGVEGGTGHPARRKSVDDVVRNRRGSGLERHDRHGAELFGVRRHHPRGGSDVLATGRWQGLEFYRWPGLTPTAVALDLGSDGDAELAGTGMLTAPAQTGDLAPALNAYLAAHADGDDGAVDGFVAVPIAVTSAGAGQVQLADLEIAYTPASGIAAYAQPPVFSPSASPGVLDSSILSLLASGSITVVDAAGTPRRTLSSTASGGRFIAAFDGRDDVGSALPSGRYPFGLSGAAPVADVEIDDIPPTVVLRSTDEGSYGGVAAIQGTATDLNYAGTSRTSRADPEHAR